MKRALSCLLIAASFSGCLQAAPILKIGVEQSVLLGSEKSLIDETVAVIRKEGGRDLQVEVLPEEKLKKAVENNEIDLFISTAFFYSSMAKSAVRDLASVVSERTPDANQGQSSTILVREADKSLRTLSDLKDKTVFFNPAYGREVVYSFFAEVKNADHTRKPDFDYFYRTLKKADLSLKEQVRGLNDGAWDALLIPGCLLETEGDPQTMDLLTLRVLGAKTHPNYRCLHSTALYPNITIGTLPSASAALTRRLSLLILSLPPTAEGLRWGTASDFSKVDTVLKSMGLDAYAEDRKWTAARFIREYGYIFWSMLLILLGLAAHSIRSEALVKKRTAELSEALELQAELKKRASDTEQKLDKLQRLGTVSQISSLFAHELRQPLNAIRCYAFSLNKLCTREDLAACSEKFSSGLEEISAQTRRADEIIQKVRDYVKNKSSTPQNVNFDEHLDRVTAHFLSRHPECRFHKTGQTRTAVKGDPLEIELILTNLIRNSYEASSVHKTPLIYVSAQIESEGFLSVHVWDNGPKISEERVKNFVEGLQSTKADGLGLGLSIVRTFVEKHGGILSGNQSILGGLLIRFTLPVAEGCEPAEVIA